MLLLPSLLGDGTGALEADLAAANEALEARAGELEETLAANAALEARLDDAQAALKPLEAELGDARAAQEALEDELDDLRGAVAELEEQGATLGTVLERLLEEIGDELDAAVDAEIARACAAAIERGDADADAVLTYADDWDYVTDRRSVARSATECAEAELARIAEEEAERERQAAEARRRAEEEAEAAQRRQEEQAARQPQVVHPGAFCSPAGAIGVTVAGTPMECKTTATDSRARWRKR